MVVKVDDLEKIEIDGLQREESQETDSNLY